MEWATPQGLNGLALVFYAASLAFFVLCLDTTVRLFNQGRQYTHNLKKTLYAITDRRIIVITPAQRGLTMKSYHPRRYRADQSHRDWRRPGRCQLWQRGTQVEKLVGLPDVRTLEDLLVSTFKSPVSAASASASQDTRSPRAT